LKSLFFGFSILFILYGCANPLAHEDKVCDCYRRAMAMKGFDFDAVISFLELTFVEKGILEGTSGQDYLNGMIALLEVEEILLFDFSLESKLKLKNLDEAADDFFCFVDELSPKENSKLQKFRLALTSDPYTRRLNIKHAVHVTESVVGADGFEHPYYRAYYFKYYYRMSGLEEADFD
jgi:hypothetical protein